MAELVLDWVENIVGKGFFLKVVKAKDSLVKD